MPKYAIAFITPTDSPKLRHRLIESESREEALKRFFNEEAKEFYSPDEQGYYYFKEDFFDETAASGNVLECE